MKSIVIIASKKSGFEVSGVGKYILNFIPFFEEKGYNVEYIFQPETHGLINGYLWRLFTLPKILKNNYKEYIKIFYDESFLTSIRKSIKNTSIAIVHHTYDIEVHSFFDRIFKIIGYVGFNFFLKNASSIVVVSQETKNFLEKNKIVKNIPIYLIHNSFSIKKVKTENFLDKNFENKKILLLVASTEGRKNILTALKIISCLSDDYILIRLGKTSPGNQQSIIEKFVNEKKLNDKYFVFSGLNEKQIGFFYKKSYSLICTSLYEGFGRPIIEAQIYGLPVISTIGGGLKEVVGNSGIIIENPYDIKSYINAIEKILPQQREEIIKKGYKNIENYNVENISKIWLELINKY